MKGTVSERTELTRVCVFFLNGLPLAREIDPLKPALRILERPAT